MFECLIVGDSIALGVGQAVNASYERKCDLVAKSGAGTELMRSWPLAPKIYGSTIISAGSNDEAGQKLTGDLLELRRRIPTQRVIWLLPYGRALAYRVASVAAMFGDETLDLRNFASRDGVHPSKYKIVSKTLLKPARMTVGFSTAAR